MNDVIERARVARDNWIEGNARDEALTRTYLRDGLSFAFLVTVCAAGFYLCAWGLS